VKTRNVALVEGLVAGAFFGTAAIFIRLLPNIDSFSIAFWRLVIACVALITIIRLLRKPLRLDLIRKHARGLAILSVFLGLHFIFFISSVKDTTILNATVLVNTTPIFSMFVSAFLFKLRPSRFALMGLFLSFLGIVVIAYAETLKAGVPTAGAVIHPSPKGDLEAVAAAIVESFYLNYGRKVRVQMDILSIMVPIYAFAALLVALLVFPVTGTGFSLPLDLTAVFLVIALGIIPTATAHTLYFSSLSHLKSFETATLALLEPVGATILGFLVFREFPAPVFILGASFILLGIVLIVRNKV
jgi:drug/metabolite transporter (DMT)-like permease